MSRPPSRSKPTSRGGASPARCAQGSLGTYSAPVPPQRPRARASAAAAGGNARRGCGCSARGDGRARDAPEGAPSRCAARSGTECWGLPVTNPRFLVRNRTRDRGASRLRASSGSAPRRGIERLRCAPAQLELHSSRALAEGANGRVEWKNRTQSCGGPPRRTEERRATKRTQFSEERRVTKRPNSAGKSPRVVTSQLLTTG